jgi:hypothetical protein
VSRAARQVELKELNMAPFDVKNIEKYKFSKIGYWKSAGDEIELQRIKFEKEKGFGDEHRGYFYIWLAEKNNQHELLYVGKAGGSLGKRCAQHVGGFSRSNTGRAHAERIRGLFDTGYGVSIYARESPKGEILEQEISMCAAEEVALITKFNPPWNKKSEKALKCNSR